MCAILLALGSGHAVARPLENSDLPIELRDQNIAATLKAAREHHAAAWNETGEASFYRRTRVFRWTASGERYDENSFTAAHHTLPFGTRVRVTNLANGRSVVVRINDRPAPSNHRVIDLASGAAAQLGMMGAGVADVELTLAGDNDPVEVAEVPEALDPPIAPRATAHAAVMHHGARRHLSHAAAAHHVVHRHSAVRHSVRHQYAAVHQQAHQAARGAAPAVHIPAAT